MDDASLDDFLGDDEDESDGAADADPTSTESDPDADPAGDERAADPADGASAGDPAADEGDEGDDGIAVDPETVEPAASTYAWSAEPVACAACGTAVRRRFRDETGLVCADCKTW